MIWLMSDTNDRVRTTSRFDEYGSKLLSYVICTTPASTIIIFHIKQVSKLERVNRGSARIRSIVALTGYII